MCHSYRLSLPDRQYEKQTRTSCKAGPQPEEPQSSRAGDEPELADGTRHVLAPADGAHVQTGLSLGGSYVADRKERGTPRKGSSGILFPKHVCPHRPGSPRHRHCWKCPNYAICPTDPLPARALHRAPQQPCPQATCSDTHTRVVLFSDDSGNHSRSEGQVMHHPTGSSSNNPDPGLNPTGGFPAPRGDLLLPT